MITLEQEVTWQKILSTIETSSTRMLLAQQAKLLKVRRTKYSFLRRKKLVVTIGVNPNWIAMIQSRRSLLEEACKKSYLSPVIVEFTSND